MLLEWSNASNRSANTNAASGIDGRVRRVALAIGLQLVAEVADKAAVEVERQAVGAGSAARAQLVGEVVEELFELARRRRRAPTCTTPVGDVVGDMLGERTVAAPMNEKRERSSTMLLSSQKACRRSP